MGFAKNIDLVNRWLNLYGILMKHGFAYVR